jgi:hypothetical protein
MAKNNGYKVEERIAEEISSKGKACFRTLNGSKVEFPVSDRVLTGGKTTRNKWDILISPAVRLQVKSTSSNRSAVVNMVPVRNLIKMSQRELIDVQPALQLMEALVTTGKAVKLSEVSNYSEWFDLLRYLLFEGTPTAQEIPALQANYLLEESAEGEHLLLTKIEAIPHIWNNLVAEIRTRKGKTEPCLHVRYGK